MTEALYERYKNALRRGHVAVLRGRHDEALDAYGEAAGLATERPLPYTSSAGVLIRLGRVAEAIEAYEAALARAPRDEAALVGRAEALGRAGRTVEAAESLDLAADVQAVAARIPEALDTARRALELAESKARRRHVAQLADQLRATSDLDQAAEQVLVRALRILGGSEPDGEAGEQPAGEADAEPAAEAAPAPVAGAEAESDPAPAAEPDAEPATADDLEAGAPNDQATPAEAAPRPDPLALRAEAETAIDAGDPVAARAALLAAARTHAGDGLYDAALDACHLALAIAPDDADVHLELVDLYLARGWHAPAAEKLLLLDRLLELDGSEIARGRVRAVVAAAFADEPRLAGLRA